MKKNVLAKLSKLKFFFYFIHLFLERQEGRETREEEKDQSVASHAPATGDHVCNPAMCPDWESNQQPFGSQTGTQSSQG